MILLRELARGEQPTGARTMNHVVAVRMIVGIQNVTIGVRADGVMVQGQFHISMRRTDRETVRPISQRH